MYTELTLPPPRPTPPPAPATGFSNGAPGDGVWAPIDEEELAIIPICGGPFALLDWLVKNFSDHGGDIGTVFHVPATLGDILTFCSSLRS